MGTNDHFDKMIKDLLENPPEPFKSGIMFYNEPGDMVEVVLSQEHCTGKRIDNLLTVMIGDETGEIVGYCVKNISSIFEKAVQGIANTKELPHRMD